MLHKYKFTKLLSQINHQSCTQINISLPPNISKTLPTEVKVTAGCHNSHKRGHVVTPQLLKRPPAKSSSYLFGNVCSSTEPCSGFSHLFKTGAIHTVQQIARQKPLCKRLTRCNLQLQNAIHRTAMVENCQTLICIEVLANESHTSANNVGNFILPTMKSKVGQTYFPLQTDDFHNALSYFNEKSASADKLQKASQFLRGFKSRSCIYLIFLLKTRA